MIAGWVTHTLSSIIGEPEFEGPCKYTQVVSVPPAKVHVNFGLELGASRMPLLWTGNTGVSQFEMAPVPEISGKLPGTCLLTKGAFGSFSQTRRLNCIPMLTWS